MRDPLELLALFCLGVACGLALVMIVTLATLAVWSLA